MRPKERITREMIAKRNEYLLLVSNLTGVPVDDIMSSKRVNKISLARQLVEWSLVKLCGYTQTQAGILMGRNHATVSYAVQNIDGGYMGKLVTEIRKQLIEYSHTKKIEL